MYFLSLPFALLLTVAVCESSQMFAPFFGGFESDNGLEYPSSCVRDCRQSPINITKRLVPTFSPPLTFNMEYGKVPRRIDMHSDGHSIVLKFFGINPEISSGPLNDIYQLHSLHFHWGKDDYSGSEHTVNGIQYPMEMHVVHTKNGINLTAALEDPTGISVIGYFFEIKPTEHTKAMRRITEELSSLTARNPKTIKRKFPLSDLVMPFHDGYVSYSGSLTTEPYSEAVIWILSPYTIKITPRQMAAFRNLAVQGIVKYEENFRATQPLNRRKVRYNFLPTAPTTVCGCSAVNNYWFENIFTSLLISIY